MYKRKNNENSAYHPSLNDNLMSLLFKGIDAYYCIKVTAKMYIYLPAWWKTSRKSYNK